MKKRKRIQSKRVRKLQSKSRDDKELGARRKLKEEGEILKEKIRAEKREKRTLAIRRELKKGSGGGDQEARKEKEGRRKRDLSQPQKEGKDREVLKGKALLRRERSGADKKRKGAASVLPKKETGKARLASKERDFR